MCFIMSSILLDQYQIYKLLALINCIEEQCFKTYAYLCINKKKE